MGARQKEDGTYDLNDGFFLDGQIVDPKKVLDEFLTPKPPRWAGSIPYPRKVVTDVACGRYHVLVVARDPNDGVQNLYSSGNNTAGQLGHGDDESRHELTRVQSLTDISKVAAGEFFSLALSSTLLELYSFGKAVHGALGLGLLEDKYIHTPQQVAFPGTYPVALKEIGAGPNHSFAISVEGELYTWGGNRDTLTTGHSSDRDVYRPRLLDLGEVKPLQAAGGSQHSVFLVQGNFEQNEE